MKRSSVGAAGPEYPWVRMLSFGMELLEALVSEFWMILTEAAPWLLVGLALAGVVHAFIPGRLLDRALGGTGIGPIARASLLGIPLPLCSCSVIPVAAGLRRGGASKGSSAAFAISTPQTGEESIPLTWALLGPWFALARPVVAVVTAFTAGVLINRLTTDEGPKRGASEDPHCDRCAADGDTPDEPKPSIASRAKKAVGYGFGTMLLDLAPWLVVGLVLSAVVAALVPEQWIEQHVGGGILPMLAMLVVGLPIYVCSTSSTPLAAALVAAGVSPGAALVLLLAGPATNLATMAWLIKDLGVKSLVLYLATIAVFAVGAGWLVDQFLGAAVQARAEEQLGGAHEAPLIAVISAIVFGALLAGGLVIRVWQRFAGGGEHAHHQHGAAATHG